MKMNIKQRATYTVDDYVPTIIWAMGLVMGGIVGFIIGKWIL